MTYPIASSAGDAAAARRAFFTAMPKVELHVHFEGAMTPETVLMLAEKNGRTLPASTVEGMRDWFTFTDFPHFAEIYWMCASCLQTPDDFELAARAFLEDRARQNIVWSEVTYTGYARYRRSGLPWAEQIAAINRARAWGERELGVGFGLIVDIARDDDTPEQARTLAGWVAESHARDEGVLALGLGGYEVGFPVALFADALADARAAGVPLVLHAGETEGPASIRAALDAGAVRIGHGVRALEDPALVSWLRDHGTPLEVCPTSNVCLRVVPSLDAHPIRALMDAGLYVTLNSDDPPMFNTTLTDEFIRTADVFGFTEADGLAFTRRAIDAALLSAGAKARLHAQVNAFAAAHGFRETPDQQGEHA
jgi:adenosine deaminase